MRWLLLSLALQNLGRRKARSLLLIAAVALGSGVVFTGAVLMQSIDRSMAVGFTRLGADMMVVPEGALTNITASLLVVEPSELVLDADALAKARLASLGRIAAAEDRAGRAFGHRQPSRVGRPDRLRAGAGLHRPALAGREDQSALAGRRRHPGRGARRRAGQPAPDLRQAACRLRPARPHRRRHPRARRVHVVRHARRAGRSDAAATAPSPPCWRPARSAASWPSWRPAPRRCRRASPSCRT